MWRKWQCSVETWRPKVRTEENTYWHCPTSSGRRTPIISQATVAADWDNNGNLSTRQHGTQLGRLFVICGNFLTIIWSIEISGLHLRCLMITHFTIFKEPVHTIDDLKSKVKKNTSKQHLRHCCVFLRTRRGVLWCASKLKAIIFNTCSRVIENTLLLIVVYLFIVITLNVYAYCADLFVFVDLGRYIT
jgi:hypothetical protein